MFTQLNRSRRKITIAGRVLAVAINRVVVAAVVVVVVVVGRGKTRSLS